MRLMLRDFLGFTDYLLQSNESCFCMKRVYGAQTESVRICVLPQRAGSADYMLHI